MFDEARKKAIESRAKALATQALLALTDAEAEKLRGEMMRCIVELSDDHHSVALQYQDPQVRSVVQMNREEKWNKGVEFIFKEMQCVIDTGDWSKLAKVYEMIARLHELIENRR